MQLKNKMIAVVLVDRICKEVLGGSDAALAYGVVPLFDEIVTLMGKELTVGAICGEFLLLPKSLVTVELAKLATEMKKHPYNADYYFLSIDDKKRHKLMQETTRLLTQHELNILVGTVSLLGEGWDCPEINLLILANQAASFVQTQQLRGRGFRLGGSEKVTNIWHLAIGLPGVALAAQPDLARMLRRLSYISGLDFDRVARIESGGDRFMLPMDYTTTTMETYTQSMFHYSSERELLKERWQTALNKGWHLSMPVIIRRLAKEEQSDLLHPAAVRNISPINFWTALLHGHLSRYFHVRSQRKAWQKECQRKESIAASVLRTLQELGDVGDRKLIISSNEVEFSCYLEDANYREGQLFAQVISELFAPINNPRYLIEGKKMFLPVPERFGRNKQIATIFLKELNKQSRTNYRLIYTRNPTGRQKLVDYRMIQTFNPRDEAIMQKNIWT